MYHSGTIAPIDQLWWRYMATVLIIEDEPVVALDLSEELLLAGFAPLPPCHNYEEALSRLNADLPRYCILDLRLGGHSFDRANPTSEGRRLFWILQGRRVRTVIHSAYADELERSPADPAFYRTVYKPAPATAVIDALRELAAEAD
jgi:ActR/RegA family two-component response regulator